MDLPMQQVVIDNSIPQPTTPNPVARRDTAVPQTESAGRSGVPPVTVPAPRKPFPWLPVILSLLFAATLATLAFLFFRYQASQKELSVVPSPIPTSSATALASVDPTFGWVTVSNDLLQFSLKYPSGWFVEHNDKNGIRLQNYDPATAPGRGYDPVSDKGKYGVIIGKSAFSATTIEQLKTLLPQNHDECMYMGDPAGTTIVSNELSSQLNGYSIYSRTTECSESTGSNFTQTYILDGQGRIMIFSKILDIVGYDSLYQQILSTFRFTQSTNDLQTYTNPVRHYSISYPSSWTIDKSQAETAIDDVSGAELTFSKNGATLTINWPSAYGPNICLFDDQPREGAPEMADYCEGKFVEFQSVDGSQIYRHLVQADTSFQDIRIAVYTKEKGGNYFVTVPPITYKFTQTVNKTLVQEMDNILASYHSTD